MDAPLPMPAPAAGATPGTGEAPTVPLPPFLAVAPATNVSLPQSSATSARPLTLRERFAVHAAAASAPEWVPSAAAAAAAAAATATASSSPAAGTRPAAAIAARSGGGTVESLRAAAAAAAAAAGVPQTTPSDSDDAPLVGAPHPLFAAGATPPPPGTYELLVAMVAAMAPGGDVAGGQRPSGGSAAKAAVAAAVAAARARGGARGGGSGRGRGAGGAAGVVAGKTSSAFFDTAAVQRGRGGGRGSERGGRGRGAAVPGVAGRTAPPAPSLRSGYPPAVGRLPPARPEEPHAPPLPVVAGGNSKFPWGALPPADATRGHVEELRGWWERGSEPPACVVPEAQLQTAIARWQEQLVAAEMYATAPPAAARAAEWQPRAARMAVQQMLVALLTARQVALHRTLAGEAGGGSGVDGAAAVATLHALWLGSMEAPNRMRDKWSALVEGLPAARTSLEAAASAGAVTEAHVAPLVDVVTHTTALCEKLVGVFDVLHALLATYVAACGRQQRAAAAAAAADSDDAPAADDAAGVPATGIVAVLLHLLRYLQTAFCSVLRPLDGPLAVLRSGPVAALRLPSVAKAVDGVARAVTCGATLRAASDRNEWLLAGAAAAVWPTAAGAWMQLERCVYEGDDHNDTAALALAALAWRCGGSEAERSPPLAGTPLAALVFGNNEELWAGIRRYTERAEVAWVTHAWHSYDAPSAGNDAPPAAAAAAAAAGTGGGGGGGGVLAAGTLATLPPPVAAAPAAPAIRMLRRPTGTPAGVMPPLLPLAAPPALPPHTVAPSPAAAAGAGTPAAPDAPGLAAAPVVSGLPAAPATARPMLLDDSIMAWVARAAATLAPAGVIAWPQPLAAAAPVLLAGGDAGGGGGGGKMPVTKMNGAFRALRRAAALSLLFLRLLPLVPAGSDGGSGAGGGDKAVTPGVLATLSESAVAMLHIAGCLHRALYLRAAPAPGVAAQLPPAAYPTALITTCVHDLLASAESVAEVREYTAALASGWLAFACSTAATLAAVDACRRPAAPPDATTAALELVLLHVVAAVPPDQLASSASLAGVRAASVQHAASLRAQRAASGGELDAGMPGATQVALGLPRFAGKGLSIADRLLRVYDAAMPWLPSTRPPMPAVPPPACPVCTSVVVEVSDAALACTFCGYDGTRHVLRDVAAPPDAAPTWQPRARLSPPASRGGRLVAGGRGGGGMYRLPRGPPGARTTTGAVVAATAAAAAASLPAGAAARRVVVVDGPNVAMRAGDGEVFLVGGLVAAAKYYQSRNCRVVTFLPAHLLSDATAARHAALTKAGVPIRGSRIPDNLELLRRLVEKRVVFVTPSDDYDDDYAIQYTLAHPGAIVLSNDQYRDYVSAVPLELRPLAAAWVDAHRVPFSFVGGGKGGGRLEFVPSPRFLLPDASTDVATYGPLLATPRARVLQPQFASHDAAAVAGVDGGAPPGAAATADAIAAPATAAAAPPAAAPLPATPGLPTILRAMEPPAGAGANSTASSSRSRRSSLPSPSSPPPSPPPEWDDVPDDELPGGGGGGGLHGGWLGGGSDGGSDDGGSNGSDDDGAPPVDAPPAAHHAADVEWDNGTVGGSEVLPGGAGGDGGWDGDGDDDGDGALDIDRLLAEATHWWEA